MTDPQWETDPRDQEQLVNRHPYGKDPTKLDEERTSSGGSTISNSDLSDGRDSEPVLPSNDSTLNTKI